MNDLGGGGEVVRQNLSHGKPLRSLLPRIEVALLEEHILQPHPQTRLTGASRHQNHVKIVVCNPECELHIFIFPQGWLLSPA
jgi:hypothetical protein